MRYGELSNMTQGQMGNYTYSALESNVVADIHIFNRVIHSQAVFGLVGEMIKKYYPTIANTPISMHTVTMEVRRSTKARTLVEFDVSVHDTNGGDIS